MGEIIVGVDIGTSKVCTIIGQLNKDNNIDILGRGIDSCTGVKKGVIIDIDSTANSIKSSLAQAESEANLKVASAFVNIAGTHVTLLNSRNSINISGENREITAQDVEKLLHTAGNVPIPEDRQIIDVIPRQYIVDGYDEIVDPVGMAGVRLEADVDIVAGKITSVQNIVKSMDRAGLKIDGLVLEALATSEVTLTPDEKEMGVIMIDIGGGITDISVFRNKKLLFYDSIPVGGDHITSDISIGLKIPNSEAEKIKREFGLALTSLIKNDQDVIVNDVSENKKKSVRVSEVVEIIEARVYEIFSLCGELLQKSGISGSFGAGVVLTGGGVSYADGVMQLAYEVFDLPVRIANHKLAGIPKLEQATAAGIVKYVSSYCKEGSQGSSVKVHKQKSKKKESKGIKGKILKFFNDLFFTI
ncbi:MAG: cell division protein FtsA [Clostridia bacterium]|nr:cell division protein FtsA [Clostridia bacterium]